MWKEDLSNFVQCLKEIEEKELRESTGVKKAPNALKKNNASRKQKIIVEEIDSEFEISNKNKNKQNKV